MSDELINQKFTDTNRRLDGMEVEIKNITALTVAIGSVNNKVDTLTDDVGEIKTGLKEITCKPAKMWDNAVWLVLAAVIGYAVNLFIK